MRNLTAALFIVVAIVAIGFAFKLEPLALLSFRGDLAHMGLMCFLIAAVIESGERT